jgi:hypothetical protein
MMMSSEPSIVVQVLGTELARFGMYKRRLRLCTEDIKHRMMHDTHFAWALFEVLEMFTSDMEGVQIVPAAGAHPSSGTWIMMERGVIDGCWVARPFQPGVVLKRVCANDVTRLLRYVTSSVTGTGDATSSYDPLGDGAVVIHGHGNIELMRLYASGAVVLFSDPRMAAQGLQDFCQGVTSGDMASAFYAVKTALRNMRCKYTIRVAEGAREAEGRWLFVQYDNIRVARPVEPGVTVVPPSKRHPFDERAAILVTMFPPAPKRSTSW